MVTLYAMLKIKKLALTSCIRYIIWYTYNVGDGMRKNQFFYTTYFKALKSIYLVFFCPQLVTLLLQTSNIFFVFQLNPLKKYLAYNRGV